MFMHLGKYQDVNGGLGTGLVCRICVDGRYFRQYRGISVLLLVEAMTQICIRNG